VIEFHAGAVVLHCHHLQNATNNVTVLLHDSSLCVTSETNNIHIKSQTHVSSVQTNMWIQEPTAT